MNAMFARSISRTGVGAWALLFWAGTGWGLGTNSYFENWNTPATTNHNWNYWTTQDVAMVWHSAGGVGNTAYVSTPLGSCSNWLTAYWPAYTFGASRETNQDLQLTSFSTVSVFASMQDPAGLNGNQVQFFIGEWIASNNYAFYTYNAPFFVNTNNWAQHATIVLGGTQNWTLVASQGSTKTAVDLYDNPQQYGFAVSSGIGGGGGVGVPTGDLRLDNFSVVIPEPAAATLALLGAATFFLRRRLIRRPPA